MLILRPLLLMVVCALAFVGSNAFAQSNESAVVVSVGDTKEAAWALASAVYATALRPQMDEGRARALVGEDPPATGAAVLAELRKAATGDNVASRAIYARILRDTGAHSLAFVMRDPSGNSVARIYRANDSVDDEKFYPLGDPNDPKAWQPLVLALARTKAAPLAVPDPSKKADDAGRSSRPFYASPWFWGGIAAAAFTGGALYLATRDTTSGPIHLQVRTP